MDDRLNPGSDRRTGKTPLEKDLDELSLTQALRDFEIANARVVDLTQRLIESNQALVEAHAEVARMQAEVAELGRLHDEMRNSKAFRIASKLWALRSALGV